VRLDTDDGIDGLGEAPGGAETQEEILRAFEGLRGQDPFRIEAIVERLPGPHRGLYGPTPTAVSALEMAVWDIMGKAVGRPVCDLLGGRYRGAVPVCAPLFTDEDAEGDFAAATVAAAEEAIARWGFGAVKVKAGVYRPGTEIKALQALRRRFGDALALRVDPNGVWSPEESIRFGQRALDWIWSGWRTRPGVSKACAGSAPPSPFHSRRTCAFEISTRSRSRFAPTPSM
jgi:glucarate dehydratase